MSDNLMAYHISRVKAPFTASSSAPELLCRGASRTIEKGMKEAIRMDLRINRRVPTLRELAVNRLREAIITGQFTGGDRLIERVLCTHLGVSRSVVREAIRILEAEGLVEILPRVGPVVVSLDWPRARQIYNIRRLLEAEAAADCASRADATVKERLRSALAEIKSAFERGASTELLLATSRFYEVIFTAAGHDIAWEIVQRLNSRISRLRALTLASKDRDVSGYAHMARICDAICAADAAGARRAVEDHLRDAAEIARRKLEGSGPEI